MEYEKTRHGGLRRTRVVHRQNNAQIMQRQESAQDSPNQAGSEGRGKFRRVMHGLRDKYKTESQGRGSTPSPRTFTIKLREPLGLPDCPYVIRWRVETPWGSVRLHHWLSHDDDRAVHDHPWSFVTFVLKGGYTDSGRYSEEHLKAPAIRYRPATHQHTVYPDKGGCWTIIVTGPKIRTWGFWVKNKFVKMNKYFLTYGHHPCD